ncbi:replicative DNA helicase [Andreprevotia lacus DSM 23236]|jgi:replicative DNA helicase|uniref:DNA 5'-3' helicase n=1 Tax=Andreprevotia lacus DSM 23236 TaxID=1121001 RepID=A0A1W1Y1B2_9NEIS|nr:replicative DNA helicase [Andreprevotia lacus]SMC29932.1 replicative DNA helicase [Andreprevotia lacus DSM 23236]
MSERLYNVAAEQALLGGALLAPERLAALELAQDDFAIDTHRLVFAALGTLLQHGLPVDAVTVAQVLDERGELARCGGLAYLGSLVDATPTAANIGRYADIVREHALARRLASVGVELQALAANADGLSLAERIERGMAALHAITGEVRGDEARPVAQALAHAMQQLDQRRLHPGARSGLPTGLAVLDEALLGYQRGELIVIAGRPSMGKTALAMQGAEAAARAGLRVLVFSLEMSEAQLGLRLAAGRARINLRKLLAGELDADEAQRLQLAAADVAGWPISIDASAGLSAAQVRARAQRHALRHGVDLIVIDHLGLLAMPGHEQRAQALGHASKAFKALAKQLQVPVLLVSQLNRDSAKGGQVRAPTLTDIRDSGCVEEDADTVLLLHRPGYYGNDRNPGEAEIIVAKQRMGERGQHLQCGWRGEWTRFTLQPDPHWRRPTPQPRYSGLGEGEL